MASSEAFKAYLAVLETSFEHRLNHLVEETFNKINPII